MGGKNVIVEIDEALLGKRKTMKHGNYPEILKFWVLGITERKPANKKNSKYVIIPNRSKNTLEKIIKDSVDKNSIICTDEWSGYKGLKNIYRKHCTVNHSKEFVNYKEKIVIPYIEHGL